MLLLLLLLILVLWSLLVPGAAELKEVSIAIDWKKKDKRIQEH